MHLFELSLVFGLVLHTESTKNCDDRGVLLYEDLRCKPNYDGGRCPIAFDCKGMYKSARKCHLKGKSYKLDEKVDTKLTASGCDLDCFCKQQRNGNGTEFRCDRVECPEWTNGPRPGCYRKYSLDACCSVRETCTPFDNSTTCLYDGKVYKEGENILPRDSCWRCVCQEGFRGRIEAPFCRRRACNTQIKSHSKIQQMCAPVYFQRKYREDNLRCCPSNWICADGKERIIGKATNSIACRFGNKSVKVGEMIMKTMKIANVTQPVRCKCEIPPFLTCTTEVI